MKSLCKNLCLVLPPSLIFNEHFELKGAPHLPMFTVCTCVFPVISVTLELRSFPAGKCCCTIILQCDNFNIGHLQQFVYSSVSHLFCIEIVSSIASVHQNKEKYQNGKTEPQLLLIFFCLTCNLLSNCNVLSEPFSKHN